MIANKHEQFRDRIKPEIYNTLEMMYAVNQSSSNDIACNKELTKLINIQNIQTIDKKMKISIYYLRWCKTISYVLEYYENKSEKSEILTDYYINSNILKEMNYLGLGYYFDVKYPKDRTNLYSVSYGEDSNWIDWLQNRNVNENQLKEYALQLIFKGCNEHINRGGNIKLKSLSKCFGIDLFKYMHLDENGNANLYIIKNTEVNFIQTKGERKSIQEYLMSDEYFDVSNNPQFCIDFTNVRDGKLENYNNWSKNFLGDKQFISQQEFDNIKKHLSDEYKYYDALILDILERTHKNGTDKAISSRVSPIKDREVIVSDTLWKIDEYNPNNFEKIQNEKCYHFVFSKQEYLQLIYYYFKSYAENKSSSIKYDEIYNNRLESLKKDISEKVEKLKSDNSKVEEDKKLKLKFYSKILDILNIDIPDNIPEKIKFALENVNWESEKIPDKWSRDNIYPCKNNIFDNLLINCYKCLCKDITLGIRRG